MHAMNLQIVEVLLLFLMVNGFIDNYYVEEDIKYAATQLKDIIFSQQESISILFENGLEHILPTISEPRVIWNINKTLEIGIYFYTNYLFYMKESSSIGTFISFLKSSVLWKDNSSPPSKYLIVVFNKTNLEHVYRVCWQNDISDVIVASVGGNGTFNLYKSNPYWKENNCWKNVTLKSIGIGKSKNLSITTQDAEKISKCKFVIGYQLITPRPYILNEPNSGILFNLSKVIEDAMYLDVELKLQDFQGEFILLKNISRQMKVLNEKHVDVIPYVIKDSLFSENFGVTKEYFFDDGYFVTAKPPKRSNFKVLLSSFTQDIWLLMLLTYVLFSLSYYYCLIYVDQNLKKLSHLNKCFFQIFTLTLCSSVKITTKVRFTRFLLTIYIIYSMHLASYFQAKLSSKLTSPGYEPGVRNMKNLADSKVIPLLYNVTKRTMIESKSSLFRAIGKKAIVKKEHNEDYDQIKYAVLNPDKAVLISYSYIVTHKRYSKKVNVFLSGNALEAGFNTRKGHPLFKKLNHLMERILEAGLCIKWLKEMETVVLDEPIIHAVLNLEHIIGSLLILLIGYCVSTVIFIIECYKIRK